MFIGLLSICTVKHLGDSLASNSKGCLKYKPLNKTVFYSFNISVYQGFFIIRAWQKWLALFGRLFTMDSLKSYIPCTSSYSFCIFYGVFFINTKN